MSPVSLPPAFAPRPEALQLVFLLWSGTDFPFPSDLPSVPAYLQCLCGFWWLWPANLS